MSLSSKSVKDIKALVKSANASIRAEHKVMKKKVLDKIRVERKVEMKKARDKLNEMLKKKLIPITRRQKSDLIADLNRNKKHWSLSDAPAAAAPAAPAEKKAFVTKRIGGKIRRIPVDNLKKADEKKKAEKRREKDAARSEAARKAKSNVIAKIRKTDKIQKALTERTASKKAIPKKPFNCNKCEKGSYTARCVPCMRKDLAKEAEAKKPKPKPKVPTITITEAPKERKKINKKVKSQLPPLKEKPVKIRLPKAAAPAKAAAAPAKAAAKAPAKSNGDLKALKKKLKAAGVSSMVLKFIKTVEAAKDKLEEVEGQEADSGVAVDPIYLRAVSSKDRKEVELLVKMILPRNEYTLEDQRDYFDTMKDMNDEWAGSAKPRIKYEDMFDAAEKELFRLLYPKWFVAPAPAKKTKEKTESKKSKDKS